MFSGIGPYAIEIAKHTKAKEVVGVELNEIACEYAVANAALNKVNVVFHCGDVRKTVSKLGKFDRILMPLPKGAEEFLETAFSAAKKGTIIHFYDFEHEEDIPEKAVEKVKVKKVRILRVVKCGQLGVRQDRVCVDCKVL